MSLHDCGSQMTSDIRNQLDAQSAVHDAIKATRLETSDIVKKCGGRPDARFPLQIDYRVPTKE